jgi:tetratricopeptide (TPR) repeat protein
LAEAAQPLSAALETSNAQKDWNNAARDASNLSELYLTSGDLPGALGSAHQSVELADSSQDAFLRMANRTTLADALHQEGQLDQAEALFREAEGMQKELQPEFSFLYSLPGFRYCDLLLSQGEFSEVLRRAEYALEIVLKGSKTLLDIALNILSLGRAHLLQAQGAKKPDYTQAADHLERAVTGLREAGQLQYIPLGLLARAEMQRAMKEYERAQADLEEAHTIATRGGMRLYEADYHLGYARLYLAMGKKDKAREHWEKAKKMVDEMGYHRRDGEVEELEKELSS